jgi:adenine-specific DNA-methyltransferase
MPEAISSDLLQAPAAPSAAESTAQQSLLGQFMTPRPVAKFMAGLFTPSAHAIRLLDAGAGRGALTTAFIERWQGQEKRPALLTHAYEIDPAIMEELQVNLESTCADPGIQIETFSGDFIERAATMIRLKSGPRYTRAILNPPYKKINKASAHRHLLRSAGLETVNLYSGFVALAVELLEPGGEIVAIIPRSFCNGPYYQPFRRFIMSRAAIRHIHLFEARNKAFKGDGVLQENVIIHLERGAAQGPVTISTSEDESFTDYEENSLPFTQIVSPDDADEFIHIPIGEEGGLLQTTAFTHQLSALGLAVSTGPVVDFRMKDDLRADPEPGSVPLLYPGHFADHSLEWPKPGFKKPNAICVSPSSKKWLMPSGFYAVVRRFSSKEERRRIVAYVVDPALLNATEIGFENHLNVFHQGKKPLAEDIARGLAVYLNTTMVDQYFRRFNGHTQVNATDLRSLTYPSLEILTALGVWARSIGSLTQTNIDQKVSEFA